jgi:hypothetical protein
MIFQGEASFVTFLFTLDCRAKITRNEAEFWTKEAKRLAVTMANKGKIFGFKNKIKQLNK